MGEYHGLLETGRIAEGERLELLVDPQKSQVPLPFARQRSARIAVRDIFPMDANERIINRLERLYSLFGTGNQVDSVVSVGGHAYRKDIRQATYRFLNIHLKQDARAVADSELDLATN